jgi:DNA primase
MEVSVAGLARIKQQNRIEDVVSERGITLKRKGRQLFALCPFHKEKSPSFCVTPGGEAGRFHCFGGNCGATGDVIGFLVKHEGVTFREAVKTLCQRSGLRFEDVVEETPKQKPVPPARKEKPTRAAAREVAASEPEPQSPAEQLAPGAALALVVDHYHRKLAEHPEALRYLQTRRGLSDLDLLRAHKVGVADGSLLKAVPKAGRLREQLVALGVITQDGRELLGGCIVVPIPDPLTGQWTTLYGRGIKSARHCYLPGPLRGVLNFQAAKLSEEIVLTESILDALSFHQAGVATAIPIYGTQGFLADHLDLLKREGVQRAILALDNDEPGRRAAEALKERLSAAGLAVRIASFPAGIKDANELLVSRNGDAGACFRQLLDEAEPKPAGPDSPTPATEPELDSAPSTAATVPADQLLPEASHPPDADPAPGESFASQAPVPAASNAPRTIARDAEGQITLSRRDITFKAHVVSSLLGRLRVTIKLARGAACHVDTLDLYASRARSEFARRAAKALNLGADEVEADLLALLVEAEKVDSEAKSEEPQGPPPMTDSERAEALAFLKCPDLLAQVARDIETLGFVGEDVNKRLLYLVAISRKLPDPLSAVILSQSGAGKSGLAEVIEKLTPASPRRASTTPSPASWTASSSSWRNATGPKRRTIRSGSCKAARS